MTVQQLIATSRHDRRRREGRLVALLCLLLSGALATFALLPHWGPEALLINLGILAAFVLATLYGERSDAWQRRRALLGFAVGGAAALVVLAIQLALVSNDPHHQSNPLHAARAFFFAWLVSDVLLHQWPNLRRTGE